MEYSSLINDNIKVYGIQNNLCTENPHLFRIATVFSYWSATISMPEMYQYMQTMDKSIIKSC